MKKFFFTSIIIFLFLPCFVLAISSGNATDKYNYELTEIILPDTPTTLYLFAYYDNTGTFITSSVEDKTAGYLKDNYSGFGDGQNIKVIYAYQDDILSYNYDDVIADYEGREYQVIYYTNVINIGMPASPVYSFSDDISIISYNATTTKIDSFTTLTTGEYFIPFNLFIFMAVLFFAIMLVAVLSIYFLKIKKDEY